MVDKNCVKLTKVCWSWLNSVTKPTSIRVELTQSLIWNWVGKRSLVSISSNTIKGDDWVSSRKKEKMTFLSDPTTHPFEMKNPSYMSSPPDFSIKNAAKKTMVTIMRAPGNALFSWRKGSQIRFWNVHQLDRLTQIFHLLLLCSLSFHL